jgi:acyl carrier protein
LPAYMVPSAFVLLDVLPLTSNGKIDHRALLARDQARPTPEKAFVAPRTPLESLIAEIWQDVLGVDRVGVHDNFFDLGGHSLLSMQVIAGLEKKIGLRLNPREMILPTLAQLASSCEGRMHLLQQPEPLPFTKRLFHTIKNAVSHRTGEPK